MIGKANETNIPCIPGMGFDERTEKQINEEIKGNIPKVPQEGKNGDMGCARMPVMPRVPVVEA